MSHPTAPIALRKKWKSHEIDIDSSLSWCVLHSSPKENKSDKMGMERIFSRQTRSNSLQQYTEYVRDHSWIKVS